MKPLQKLIARMEGWTGIAMDRGGQVSALEKFIGERSRALGRKSVQEYVDMLMGPADPEVLQIINAITVNYTWFFRDEEQLEGIAELLKKGFPPGKTLNLWVAGCSTGEDPYTLAMLGAHAGRHVEVLGTDINSNVLEHGRTAQYGTWSVREFPALMRPHVTELRRGCYEVNADIRKRVRFEHHNLLDLPPKGPEGGWDLILCRNVLIYFRPEKSAETIERLGRTLGHGGWLLLGSSEVLHRDPQGLAIGEIGKRVALRRPMPDEVIEPRSSKVPTLTHLPPSAQSLPLKAPLSLAAPVPRAHVGPSSAASKPQKPALQPMSAEAKAEAIAKAEAPIALPKERATPVAELTALGEVARGNLELEAGAHLKALDCYQSAIQLDPLCIEAHLFTGIAFHQMGDSISALRALRGALFLSPGLWPAAFYLALTYETLGQGNDARREYRRVVELSDQPTQLRTVGAVLRDLDAWKSDVVMLARKRSGAAKAAR
jgi:chemotaxis protein methyltransferase CheR